MSRHLLLYTFSLLSFLVCSCNDDVEDTGKPKPMLNFIGDSIIEYWRNLGNHFKDYDCHNYGWSGKGIATFLGRIDASTLAGTECVVEIGTNDIRRVVNNGNMDAYVAQYIEVLKSLNAKRIYLFSLLPRNRLKDGNFPYNEHYVVFNQTIMELTQAEMPNVVYVPVFDAFIKDGEINWDYTNDGLHPNQQGYDVMARELRKYLVKESSSIQ